MIRALGWDHPRCRLPMVAASDVWTGEPVQWQWRSLEEFGDQPAHAVAASCDLLIIDHPSIGEAVAAHAIVPVDAHVPAAALRAIRDDVLGPNIAAYERDGRLWALPVDAASQAAAWRDGILEPPSNWEGVIDLARDGGVCLALHPAQAVCALGSLCAMRGAPLGQAEGKAVWERAYEDLRAVADLGPREQFAWQQPDVLAHLSQGTFRYTPLIFAFAGYEAAGVRFGPPPAPDGFPSVGTLGGAGIALTTSCSEDAASFATWLASPDVQRDIVLANGGQPAGRRAWDAAAANDGGRFFAVLRESIERAWIRPTSSWWPEFQRRGGECLAESLKAGQDPVTAIRRLSGFLPHQIPR